MKLLSLPREVGLHPETGKPITAGLGRYGPFILHDGTYANLPTVEEVFDVGINRAVALLAEKKAGGGKGRFQRAAPTVLKELGEHPERGRQGAGAVRPLRTLRQARRRQRHAAARQGAGRTLTMDEAVQLIAERAAKGPSKPESRAPPDRQQGRWPRCWRQGQAEGHQAERQSQRQTVRDARGGGVGSRTHHDGVTQTKTSPPPAGTAEQASHSRLCALCRYQSRQARNHACVRRQG